MPWSAYLHSSTGLDLHQQLRKAAFRTLFSLLLSWPHNPHAAAGSWWGTDSAASGEQPRQASTLKSCCPSKITASMQ